MTNGITWQFYLPLEEGSWEQRRFFTIDLMEQPIDDAIEKFESLLSRKNIDSDIAYQNAKSIYEGKQKSKIIKENLPKAWQKLISEPNEILVELLNDTLEKMSGYRIEENQIIEFLHSGFIVVQENLPIKLSREVIKIKNENRINKRQAAQIAGVHEKTIERYFHDEHFKLMTGYQKAKNKRVTFDEKSFRKYFDEFYS